MCGIFAYLSPKPVSETRRLELQQYATKCQSRGPDATNVKWYLDNSVMMVFHRLSINDTSDNGMQPFYHRKNNELVSICNGEIYNHHILREQFSLKLNSQSDAEVVAPIVDILGAEKACQMFDGVFAFVILNTKEKRVLIGRDPIGVRPLYYGYSSVGEVIIASEMKSIPTSFQATQFPPSSTAIISQNQNMIWTLEKPIPYCDITTISSTQFDPVTTKFEPAIIIQIRQLLEKAVSKRMMSDRPIGCLLSGGLDSSIIVSILANYFRKIGKQLRTFSVGMENSVDLLAARKVADYLGTEHSEVVLTADQMFQAIPDTIYQIESYDTTTIRASTPMYLLCKWIKQNTDVTVIFSGEGSDEASGSYLYFHNAPNPESFQEESHRLMRDLYYFDVLRCDKSSAGAGLEVRVPFLDRDFLQFYCNLDPKFKMPGLGKGIDRIEKRLLRLAFQDQLPSEIVWRSKEGMSDGISSINKPWFSLIQERVDRMETQSTSDFIITNEWNPPLFPEAKYYRDLFHKYFPHRDETIPYYWLPKWSGGEVDPSARKLSVYTSSEVKYDF